MEFELGLIRSQIIVATHVNRNHDNIMKSLLGSEMPNESTLSAALGLPFAAPAALVQAIRAMYDLGGEGGRGAERLFSQVAGLYLAGADARYPQTPPELFPIAALAG